MKFYLLFSLSLITFSAHSQYWLRQGSGATNNMAYAIAVDNNGNTYSTGYFSSNITFGALTLNATGVIDLFILKTDPTGQILWAKNAGGTNITQGLTIAVNSNNIAVSGFFYGSSTFDTQTINATGQKDVFVANYDLNGNLNWVTTAGGNEQEQGNKVAFDSNGNILLTGEFASTNFIAGSQNLSSGSNSLDVFTLKYDAAGNCLWAKSGTSNYTDRGNQITSDASGNVYVAGEFSDTITFDQVHNNAMNNALFIIKYNSLGQEQWFRGMGSGNTVKMKGLQINSAGELITTGNYTSILYYFEFPTTFTLSNTYSNNIFISKINTSGDLIWSSTDGSDEPVSAECLSILPSPNSQDIFIGGTYQCRFDDYSNQYGSGVFCSIGYNDCFVAKYDNSGTWLWSRSFGGHENDYLYGLASDAQGLASICGAFSKNIFFSENSINFLGYPYIQNSQFQYCNDPDYYGYASYSNAGNTGVYLGKGIDPSREVFDFFQRQTIGCIRDFREFCINNCEDTLSFCSSGSIYANTQTTSNFSPQFHYQWNTGDTTPQIGVSITGDYWVEITSYDGCFTQTDSIYVIIYSSPPLPAISDNKGINSHALATQQINLCKPDSVELLGDVPPGYDFQWDNFPVGVNPVVIDSTQIIYFTLSDTNGCTTQNGVLVMVSEPLPVIDPRIICLNDSDRNDTVFICANEGFEMFVYDTLSNPNAYDSLCIPEQTKVNWDASVSTLIYALTTFCPPSNKNLFRNVLNDGWYQIDAEIIRQNNCDSDTFYLSKSIYVIVNPIPPDTFSFTISGDTFICPGASTTLYAYGDGDFFWSNGVSGDSSVFTAAGQHSVVGSRDTTNSFGCTVHAHGTIPFQIATNPLPVISSNPANALICPNDSVLLTGSGTGSFTWQGPNGLINSTGNSIYVTTPGFYYCILDDGTCLLNSNNIEVFQYNTPLLIPLGVSTICHNSPVTLQIITGIGSVIAWQPPLSGNSITQTVTQPGTYSCIVTVCNINTPLSLTVPGSDPVASINSSSTNNLCTGDTVILSSGYSTNYHWYPDGQSTQTIEVTSSGLYSLAITDSLGCKDSTSVSIQFTPNQLSPPIAGDSTICSASDILLTANGSSVIYWLDENLNQIASGTTLNTGIVSANRYYLLYSEAGGCRSGFDTARVFVEDCDSIFIPNVITPGNDGLNDLFPGKNENGADLSILIYNRWGKLVFESSASKEPWNGRDNSNHEVNDGTYYFILSVLFRSGKEQTFKGWVQVLNEK